MTILTATLIALTFALSVTSVTISVFALREVLDIAKTLARLGLPAEPTAKHRRALGKVFRHWGGE